MGRFIIISLILFLSQELSCQVLTEGVYPFSPNLIDKNYNDLNDFKEKIKDARIVFLGDMMHGESNIDSARIYMVKMLIEEMGFDVLAFESGIYDLYKAELLQKDEGLDFSTALRKNIFYIWTGYDSFNPLLDYLESKKDKAKIVGYDPQFSSDWYASEIGVDLGLFLKKTKVAYDDAVIEDWDFIMQDLIDFYHPDRFNKLYFNLINKKINSYLTQASKIPEFAEKAAIWKQIVESKMQLSKFFIEDGFLEKDATTFKAKDGNTRDKSMAENLQFYLDLYPDKKFICWGASAHFAKSTQKIENAKLKEFKPMASYIKRKYGDKAVVIGATGYKGQYGWEEELHDIPKAAENSFEDLVHQTDYKTALIDLSQFKNRMPLLSSAFVEGGYQIKGHWDEVFDWFLFVDEVYPKNAEIIDQKTEEKIAEETPEDSVQEFVPMLAEDRYEVLVMSRKGKSILGKVSDKHKNPIPFSAVALKGKSYGTITDENGNFSLLIPEISKKDSLVFSNVAYQSKVVAVADLQFPRTQVLLEEKTIALP